MTTSLKILIPKDIAQSGLKDEVILAVRDEVRKTFMVARGILRQE